MKTNQLFLVERYDKINEQNLTMLTSFGPTIVGTFDRYQGANLLTLNVKPMHFASYNGRYEYLLISQSSHTKDEIYEFLKQSCVTQISKHSSAFTVVVDKFHNQDTLSCLSNDNLHNILPALFAKSPAKVLVIVMQNSQYDEREVIFAISQSLCTSCDYELTKIHKPSSALTTPCARKQS